VRAEVDRRLAEYEYSAKGAEGADCKFLQAPHVAAADVIECQQKLEKHGKGKRFDRPRSRTTSHSRARIGSRCSSLEGDMAEQTCPKCGTQFLTSDGWAKAAVSLLVPAPAVPDMATQVRCPHCHHLFADGEIRHLSSSRSKSSRVLVAGAVIGAVVWAVYEGFFK